MSGIARLIEIYKLLIAVRRFLATLFLLSVFSYTKADTEIFYVPKNAIGIIKDHVTHADLSACEGLISNSRETLYKQCYGKAPDGHREQREKLGLEYYNRIWFKRDPKYGDMWGSYLRVPYEIIRLVNGQHSTNYITGPASHVKTCPDVGCFILDVTPPNTESPHTCAGNPVEILSGEKHQKEIDMLAPIEFSRYYRSLGRGGKIGKSWYHSYERSLNFVSSHPTALKHKD